MNKHNNPFERYLRKIGITDYPPPPEGVSLHSWIVSLYSKNKDLIKSTSKRQADQAEAERQKLLAEMPKGFQLAPWLSKHLKQIHKHYKATGRIKREPDAIKKIVEICRKCPSGKSVVDDSGHLRCVICGCHVEGGKKGLPVIGGKAEYGALHCEKHHW